MELIKQPKAFPIQSQLKHVRRRAFLAQMRADWGSQKIWYNGPALSIGSYVPALEKLSVVSTSGPLPFPAKPIQGVVLEIDDDGWVKLMIGFDRRDQPVYRYAKVEALQNYAKIIA